MTDPLHFLWLAVEAVRSVFSRAATVRWPNGAHAQLAGSEFIVPDGNAIRIRCPECGQTHIAKPFVREQPDGTFRQFISCPENLRAEEKAKDLEQWAVNLDALVSALVAALGLSGKPTQLGSNRVWRCGRWTTKDTQRDVLFARGLRRNDAAQFRREITRAHRPIVFVGSEIPDAEYWSGRVPPLIRLREVASLADGEIQLDLKQIVGLIRTADDDHETVIAEKKKQRAEVRLAVKNEIQSFVSKEALVAAHKKYGSCDKAVVGLKSEGVETNRWAVARAVKDAGGAAAASRQVDSASVVRTRSSRRRDTPIKRQD